MWTFVLNIVKEYAPALIKTIVCAALFFGGYFYAANKYKAVIADLNEQHASILAKQEKQNAEKLSKALDENITKTDLISRYNADIAALNSRLRAAEASSKRTDSGTGSALERKYERCRGFLQESDRLLEEACRKFGRCAVEKDTLIRLIK